MISPRLFLRIALTLASTLASAGCLDHGVFRCARNDQCGNDGTCEAAGYCSFKERTESCPSGRRYGRHAGGGLGGRCVDDACLDNAVTHIRAGGSHACVVRADGTIGCWGAGADGQLGFGDDARSEMTPVPGLTGATDVALGDRHGCARLGDGSVRCWGANDSGQLGDGGGDPASRADPRPVAGLADVTALAAGDAFTCALRTDGTVACWGRNVDGELGILAGDPRPLAAPASNVPLPRATAIAARHRHACALTDAGRVFCWGSNAQGELGNGSVTTPPDPTEVVALAGTAIVAVSAGASHTCAAATDGQLWCWGANQAGQLGDGSNLPRTRPVRVSVSVLPAAPETRFVDVAAGAAHTCARRDDRTVWCWGANQWGQLGEGTTSNIGVPVPVADLTNSADAAEIAAGNGFSCARRLGGTVACWGDDRLGQLGTGRTIDRAQPARVATLAAAASLDLGATHACARRPAAGGAFTTFCWGGNQTGQLGDGTRTDRPTPVTLKFALNASEVTAGAQHTCLRGGDGSVWCWGRADDGQLGTASQSDYLVPTAVPGIGGRVGRLAGGGAHTCALREGDVLCWGANADGQLGHGTTGDVSLPQPVVGAGAVVELALGGAHSCGRRDDGTVACWGRGTDGQLGDGAETTSATPVVVAGLTNAIDISAGDRHTCAVREGGETVCWGAGERGQLGFGQVVPRRGVPSQVMGLTGAADVAAGERHTCARRGDRSVVCWGANEAGQLGDDDRADHLRPADSPVLIDAVEIAAGGRHTCARRTDGSVSCWGDNRAGQLGEGAALQRSTPQPALIPCR